MFEYFDESIKQNIYLNIITSNNKKLTIKVVMYSDDMLYYVFKNAKETSKIRLNNIRKVEFANKQDEIAFRREKLGLPFNTEKYLSYYEDCIQKLEENTSYDKKIYKDMLHSIYSQSSDNLLVRFLKNQKEKKDISSKKNIILLSQSNLSQRKAIQNALNNDISIIQGPPGTGKTTTILSLIANFIMDNKNVVVVSKNNSAVDNIIEEFEKTDLPEFFLRFGRRKDIMEPLQEEIPTKIAELKETLKRISSDKEDFAKLDSLQKRLQKLETEIDELISIKNLIVDLKNQKKFMDKEQKIYNFKELLNENEMKIICEKNASKKRMVQIFEYSKKNHFYFFQKLIIKYYYGIKEGDINQKFYALSQLLKAVYLHKEIADKEALLLKRRLEDKQKEIEKIYEEYVDICMRVFQSFLKEKMSSGLAKNHSNDLLSLAFQVYPLILTTADAFIFNFKDMLEQNAKIDVVIIDEASQCDVLTGLPLLYAAKKIVVVGDEKQLSAITNLEVKTDIPYEYIYDDNTFLNSIKNVFNPLEKTLEEHYRCDFNIINFCNKFYYNSELKIYTEATTSSIEIVNANKYKGVQSINGSFYNKRECHTINELVNKKDDYFTITPFKEQGNHLKEYFGKNRAGTIHTFQGKGAQRVYFSAVLNDFPSCDNHIMGQHNLFTPELINVAVSRAKQKFVLVIDEEYFRKNSRYVRDINNLLDYIKIYGEKVDDKTSCWYDYLYKNIPYYRKTTLYDNEYEEVTHKSINALLDKTPYVCKAKNYLSELILNEKFLNNNPEIKKYIRNGAHADFSIFDTRTNKLKVIIELDGKEHNKEEQIKRDNYKNKAFESISIPVIRIDSKDAINNQEFIKKLQNVIEIDI